MQTLTEAGRKPITDHRSPITSFSTSAPTGVGNMTKRLRSPVHPTDIAPTRTDFT
jgi:hypothetical protein